MSNHVLPRETSPFVATRNMTPQEAVVLRVLTDQKHYGSTDEERRLAARYRSQPISKKKWKEITNDPWFQDQLRHRVMNEVATELPAIANAAVQTAKKVGKEGDTARRQIFSMIGMLVEKAPGAAGRSAEEIDKLVGVGQELSNALSRAESAEQKLRESSGASYEVVDAKKVANAS